MKQFRQKLLLKVIFPTYWVIEPLLYFTGRKFREEKKREILGIYFREWDH